MWILLTNYCGDRACHDDSFHVMFATGSQYGESSLDCWTNDLVLVPRCFLRKNHRCVNHVLASADSSTATNSNVKLKLLANTWNVPVEYLFWKFPLKCSSPIYTTYLTTQGSVTVPAWCMVSHSRGTSIDINHYKHHTAHVSEISCRPADSTFQLSANTVIDDIMFPKCITVMRGECCVINSYNYLTCLFATPCNQGRHLYTPPKYYLGGV